jgi:hypothetical protein
LPPTPSQRILVETVGGRSVALVLAGKSLSEFERSIETFAGAPICYFGLNSFHVHEEHLLERIGREFELVFVAWPAEFQRQVDRLAAYLERDSSNLCITLKANVARLRSEAPEQHRRLAARRSKILFMEDLVPADAFRIRHHVNSVSMMLASLIFSGCAGPIYILGMDAHSEPAYYRQEQLESYRPVTRDFTADVFCFTQNWQVLTGIMQAHGVSRLPPILNCNMDSRVDLFPKIAYDFFNYLVGGGSLGLARDSNTALAKLDPIGPAGREGRFPTEDTLALNLQRLHEALREKEPW